MTATATRPRTTHLDLAQRILEAAGEHGFKPGDRLAEQQIANLCKVSRTPVRAALRLLADRAILRWEPDGGYRLAVDLTGSGDLVATLPSAREDQLADAILRDRTARRLGDAVSASLLARRYGIDHKTVLRSLKRLADENWIEKAPGQSWLFRPAADSPEALGESYEFRLLLEPAAVTAPGFKLDERRAGALRQAMEAQLAQGDAGFDTREFQRLDNEFHAMIARGCANRFTGEALLDHLRLRRLPGALGSVNVFRLRQSTREHLAMLDHLEARQFAVVADLLRAHLRLSRGLRPQAANRAAPALLGRLNDAGGPR